MCWFIVGLAVVLNTAVMWALIVGSDRRKWDKDYRKAKDDLQAKIIKEALLSVKPGLTGYWQAYARNNAQYDDHERQNMELYYVKNQSILIDIKILFKTVISVLKKQGAK